MSKVSWQQWGTIEYMGVDRAKKKKIGLITYTGSIAKLLSVFFEQLKEISMHQFHKLWQLRNFNNTLQHLQIGQVLFVHDFQMNIYPEKVFSVRMKTRYCQQNPMLLRKMAAKQILSLNDLKS